MNGLPQETTLWWVKRSGDDFVPQAGCAENGQPAPPPVLPINDFDAVYTEHAPYVWRLLRGMGVSESSVADAVQDVFIVVHQRLAMFDGRHSVRTWLFHIAYRVSQAYRRKALRRRAEPLDEAHAPTTRSPFEELQRNERARTLNELLAALPEDRRLILILADIEELSAPEIADALNVPLNTIYTRLRRARIAFNEALERRKRRSL